MSGLSGSDRHLQVQPMNIDNATCSDWSSKGATSMTLRKSIGRVLSSFESTNNRVGGFGNRGPTRGDSSDSFRDATEVLKEAVDRAKEQHPSVRKTIFNEEIVASLNQSTRGWLRSFGGFFLQGTVCAIFTLVSVYDAVFKKKMTSLMASGGVDLTSVVIWASFISIFLGIGTTWINGQHSIFLSQDSLKMVLFYAPIGIGFAFTQFLGVLAFQYIPPDVFNMLDQGRVLIIALLNKFVQGKRHSKMSWLMLFIIMGTAIVYSFLRAEVQETTDYERFLVAANNLPNKFKLGNLSSALYPADLIEEVNNAVWNKDNYTRVDRLMAFFQTESQAIDQLLVKEQIAIMVNTKAINRHVECVQGHQSNKEHDFFKGVGLAFVFMTMQSSIGVYHEIVLKEYKSVPFYTQKVYQEIWGFLFSLANARYVAPSLSKLGIGKQIPDENRFFSNPFAGWTSSPWVCLVFISTLIRSWLIVVILKVLDSMTKQFCAICTTGMIYFFMLVHSCAGSPDAFFCPEGVNDISFKIATADLGVLFCVYCYITLQQEEKKWRDLVEAAEMNIEEKMG